MKQFSPVYKSAIFPSFPVRLPSIEIGVYIYVRVHTRTLSLNVPLLWRRIEFSMLFETFHYFIIPSILSFCLLFPNHCIFLIFCAQTDCDLFFLIRLCCRFPLKLFLYCLTCWPSTMNLCLPSSYLITQAINASTGIWSL